MACNLLSSSEFLFTSYNLHGLNQDEALIRHWFNLKEFDVMLVQEHLLSSSMLSRLDDAVGCNYFCFSSSSMLVDCQTDILRGRPYGGLAIIVNNDFK